MPEPETATEPIVSAGGEDGLARAGEELVAGVEHLLGEIEDALVRLEDGSYGRCSTCGAVLSAATLAEDPLLRYCDGHA